jgi:hypothetical protein
MQDSRSALGDVEQTLRALADKAEITDLLMRYCRGVDRCDEALIADCFHDGAVDDHGDFVIDGASAGPLYAQLGRSASLGGMHFLGNVLIELDDGAAFAESYFMSIKEMEKDGHRTLRVRAGRYVDRLERRHGHWRIVERIVVDEWNRAGSAGSAITGAEEFRYGRHDRSDPVYAIRERRIARTALNDPAEIAQRVY